MRIPKKLHIIWVGDEARRPDQWIQTWKDMNPTWEFKLWGNAEYDTVPWICKKQMDMLRDKKIWAGVADIMRYEILYHHGGFYVDADSMCIHPLDDRLLDNQMFAIYASETHLPGVVANGFIGSVPRHVILKELIERIGRLEEKDTYRWSFYKWKLQKRNIQAWKLVGPKLFTEVLNNHREAITLLPSILFNPKHYHDAEERAPTGSSGYPTFARHMYGSTFDSYGKKQPS